MDSLVKATISPGPIIWGYDFSPYHFDCTVETETTFSSTGDPRHIIATITMRSKNLVKVKHSITKRLLYYTIAFPYTYLSWYCYYRWFEDHRL